MTEKLHAPFPYFGGKSRVAATVWEAIGDVSHYMEPFFGSGAVLLARPEYDPGRHTETICDADGFVANVWRGIQFDPDEVAKWCDWPVNHADLMARRKVLIENGERLLENLIADPEWCDPKLAGYWVWAAGCWIGQGLTRPNAMPRLSAKGMGVHAQWLCQRPHLSHKGKGCHSQSVQPIHDYLRRLSERLRRVRVVCGDWTRICGGNWQSESWPTVGVFFDPPYGIKDRDQNLYHKDSQTVAADVMALCKRWGENPAFRIVLAGYDEYEDLTDYGWTFENWTANGGYGNAGNGQGKKNRSREKLWFSPCCQKKAQLELFK